jgi:hypothetical protein
MEQKLRMLRRLDLPRIKSFAFSCTPSPFAMIFIFLFLEMLNMTIGMTKKIVQTGKRIVAMSPSAL